MRYQVIAIAPLIFASVIAAQTPSNKLDAQRKDAILIRTSVDGTGESSTGMFIGQDANSAFFVTALHAVSTRSGPDQQIVLSTTLQVQFFGDPRLVPASVLGQFDSAKDLAVVFLPLKNLPDGMVKTGPKEPDAQMPIHILGNPPVQPWTYWPGKVQNEVAVDGDPAYFSAGVDPSLTHGYSGGPVFDDDGNFVGMHERAGKSYSVNLRSSAILADLRAWQVPYTNLVFEDVDAKRFRISREIISAFRNDDMAAVKKPFSAGLNDQVSNQLLRASWTAPTGFMGNYIGLGTQTKRLVSGYTLYVTQVLFQEGTADLRIAFDSSDAVSGLWLIPIGQHSSSELESAATNVVTQLSHGQFQSVYDAFADSVKAGNSASTVSNAWNGLTALKGPFVQEVSAQKSTEGDFVDVLCNFSNGQAVVRVSFAPSMKLIGVNFLPPS